jgi:hypothetical protein
VPPSGGLDAEAFLQAGGISAMSGGTGGGMNMMGGVNAAKLSASTGTVPNGVTPALALNDKARQRDNEKCWHDVCVSFSFITNKNQQTHSQHNN